MKKELQSSGRDEPSTCKNHSRGSSKETREKSKKSKSGKSSDAMLTRAEREIERERERERERDSVAALCV